MLFGDIDAQNGARFCQIESRSLDLRILNSRVRFHDGWIAMNSIAQVAFQDWKMPQCCRIRVYPARDLRGHPSTLRPESSSHAADAAPGARECPAKQSLSKGELAERLWRAFTTFFNFMSRSPTPSEARGGGEYDVSSSLSYTGRRQSQPVIREGQVEDHHVLIIPWRVM